MVLRLVDKVYKDYKNSLNMTPFELKRWEKTVKKRDLSGLRDVKRNLRLLMTPKKKWRMNEVMKALTTIKIIRKFKRKGAKAFLTLKNNGYNLNKGRKIKIQL